MELTFIEGALLERFEYCLLGILVFCFLVQLYFSLFVHLRLALLKISPLDEHARKPLTVVICARNEAENLQKYLPLVLEQ